jgi:hypothetical protein
MASIPAGVAVWWPASHSSIPAGWVRKTDWDTRFIKGQTGTTEGDVNGGSATHTHASGGNHVHSVASHQHSGTTGTNSSNISMEANNYHAISGSSHTHAYTVGAVVGNLNTGAGTFSTATWEPYSHLAIFIESDGTGDGFPTGCVVYYNAAAPAGWSQHSGTTGRLIRGAAASSGNGGTDGPGSANHTHNANSHSHNLFGHAHGGATTGNASSTTGGYTPLGGTNSAPNGTHVIGNLASGADDVTVQTVTGAASGDNSDYTEPPWYKLGNITPGSNLWLEHAICMWRGALGASIPEGWTHMNTASGSGAGATIDLRGKFIKSADSSMANIGATGGGAGHNHTAPGNHTHTAAHTHSVPTTGGAGGGSVYGSGTTAAAGGHTHAGGTAGSESPISGVENDLIANQADSEPLFRTVAYIRAAAEPETVVDPVMLGTHF